MSLYPDDYIDSIEIPYSEIASATNNFSDDNLIPQEDEGEEEDSSVKVYKGRLLVSGQLTDIEAHMCQQLDRIGKELHVSFALHPKNLSSVVGLSSMGIEHIVLVKKHEANGSLDKHLTASTLNWLQRLHICLSVANSLTSLHFLSVFKHNNCIIHGDIKSSKILLDHNWQPKLQGSQFSMKTRRNHPQPTTKHTSAIQYMDPLYETTRCFTHKSDVFSFGVVLFEVLFGRKAFISNDDNWYFARLARLLYKEGRLDEMIHPHLRKQMNLQSLNVFSETAYFCLEEELQLRPEIITVVKRLERALEVQKKHQSQEQSTVAVEGTSSTQLKGENLDHLRIPLIDIKLATNNFSDTVCIGSGGFGKVYKAELNSDGRNASATKENKDELYMRCRTVAIKRIFSRGDDQGEQGFLAEIEMLSKCKHPNVITLLGFCDEGPELILVYEYASNGSLADYFENDYNIINLTWAQRVQICLHIAHGLKYLHTRTEDKKKIIHRDIKSANILLDDTWVAKIADFGLSKLEDANQLGSTLVTSTIAGTEVYWDPEYRKSGKLKKASDIYSFGVVMFEIFCGRLAYDDIYTEKWLPSIVRERFNEGKLKEMVDPIVKEVGGNILMLQRRCRQDSLDTFLKIAYQCLAETQAARPTMEIIIKELEKAFDFESKSNLEDDLQISLNDLKLATGNFNAYNCIGEGKFWKLYGGVLEHTNANRCTTIVAKRWDSKSSQGQHQFFIELEILLTCKHENIIGLVGYCSEMDEKLIVYEHLSNGRLDKQLDNPSLTWMRRLQICIDIASGLQFLHGECESNDYSWIHRDIKSRSILLDDGWKAKLSNMEMSSRPSLIEKIEHVIDNAYGSLDYIDPAYTDGFLVNESDMYSLGVVLMEILCGRLASPGCEDHSQSLGPLAKRHYEEGTLDELVFEGIRDQIAPQSLTTFQRIALQCLEEDLDDRPEASKVVEKLKIALEFQEDIEIWEPKLPRDYEKIIEMSEYPMDSVILKKDLHNILTQGILLQKRKVWFSLGANGERNEMISAKFLFKNRRSHNWESIPTSRFPKVAMMLDISKLKTHIRPQYLSLGVDYSVYLVFKFRNPRKVLTTPMYVNLTYKMGNETLHSYFATWRDDEWMMIELCRCWTHKKEVDFRVQLESFSRYYCESGGIYMEGIEFRATNNVKSEQIEKSSGEGTPKRFQIHDEGEKLFSLSTVSDKKHHILSAKKAIYDSSNMTIFNSKSSVDSRFEEVIEVLAHQVLHIKCKIENQMLSPDTEYTCYLVFKLSEKCRGLHCPVRIRDLLCWNNKEIEILYFRSPSPLNRHSFNRIPEAREDGWMEVSVWKGNSNGKFKNDRLSMNLKLISYEGNMSGLILYGLEFRPM